MPTLNRIEVPCAHCGKVVSRAKSNIEGRKNVFCDQSCHMAFKTAQGTALVPCSQCGATLTRNRWQLANMLNHFCNLDCQSNFRAGRPLPNRERKVQTACANCGKLFTHIPGKKRICCSKLCGSRYNASLLMAKNLPPKFKVERVQVDCYCCGKTLQRTPKLIAKTEHQFCGKACVDSWHKTVTGESHPGYNRIKSTCTQCGAPLTTSKAQAGRTSLRFCNVDCYRKWRPGRNTGPANGAWRGGGGSKYYGSSWKQSSREVRQRDGKQCRNCGKSEKKNGRKHDIHHVIPFRNFGIERHLEANDPQNLLLLCMACHKKAEFGKISVQPRLL